MLIGSIIFGVVILISYLIFLYIRSLYREYDRKETLKEKVLNYRVQIKQAQDYFRKTYEHNIYASLKVSIDFCLKLIYNKSLEDQVKNLETLYKVLYEVGCRLKKDYTDVNYILAPLIHFRSKLFEEQMDYIKENSPDNLIK
jgi:hypothetical protein